MVVLKPDGEVLLIIIGFLEKGDKWVWIWLGSKC
jgi:hypothetical protein